MGAALRRSAANHCCSGHCRWWPFRCRLVTPSGASRIGLAGHRGMFPKKLANRERTSLLNQFFAGAKILDRVPVLQLNQTFWFAIHLLVCNKSNTLIKQVGSALQLYQIVWCTVLFSVVEAYKQTKETKCFIALAVWRALLALHIAGSFPFATHARRCTKALSHSPPLLDYLPLPSTSPAGHRPVASIHPLSSE